MKNHLHRLGIIYTVYGWFAILLTIPLVFLSIQDIRRLEYGTNVTEWQFISFLIIGFVLLFFIFSLFYLLFGNALKNERVWATRVAGFIIGFLLLFQFPIGSIIGGYTLWVLVKLDQSELNKNRTNHSTLR